MYIKVFRTRNKIDNYLLFNPTFTQIIVPPNQSTCFYLENEKHERIEMEEIELFDILDKLFKDKQNATD